ncbi:hypothetical protein CN939_19550 [Bacillus thuringiensis]|nr:hypothetical protein CON51_04975 [Bacillus thuringiensis]PGQ97043.1 hypothetical protein COA28_03115 [Bacillus cereus]PES54736.1 hypothetical protein CN506_19775 [Bacillus thuringiensis]PFP03572.1 hypothetical protein COJ91_22545 [Bacillus thuringiensis]PFS55692.1 hypothetical protein COK64_23385 [Bacillus thuringiensis]
MKSKELEAKTFTLTITGDVSAGRLEDALYVGLERNEENWRKFSIKEQAPKVRRVRHAAATKPYKTENDDHIIAGRC